MVFLTAEPLSSSVIVSGNNRINSRKQTNNKNNKTIHTNSGNIIPNESDTHDETYNLKEMSPASKGSLRNNNNNNSNTNNTRSYKERPCDKCRRRKSKCVFIENESICVFCKSRNESCTFVEEPQRRKKRRLNSNEDFLNENENSSLSLNSNNINNKTKSKNNKSKKTTSLSPNDISNIDLGNNAYNSPNATNGNNITNTSNMNINDNIDNKYQNENNNKNKTTESTTVGDYASLKGPSLLKKTLGLQYSRCSILVGPTNMLDYSLLNRVEFNIRQEAAEGSLPLGLRLRRANDDAIFLMQEDHSIEGNENISRQLESIEKLVSPYSSSLVELYFRIIHPSFPILHKKVVLEKYKRSYKEFSPPLLGAIYALALGWWSYAPNLPQDDGSKPNAEKIYQLALDSFNEVTKHPKLSTVQAGLLLLQKQRSTYNENWTLLAQVVALSEDLGLHLDCTNWKIPRWERKLRRRLAWALWIQDKWNSLSHSRPPFLNSSDNWLVKPLTDEDFPDKPIEDNDIEGSSDIENGKLIFQYMVYLTGILNNILKSLFSAASLQNLTDCIDILQVARPLQEELKNWAKSIPENIRMTSIKSRKFSSNGFLYLAYLSAEITLHRRIIHSLDLSSTSADLIHVCRNAAKERLIAALNFVRDLRPEHVQGFWHSSASSNFALIGSFGALLLVTALEEEEAKFIRNSLKNYRWMLRVSSIGSEQMAGALNNLELVLSFIPDLKEPEKIVALEETHEIDSEISDDDEEIVNESQLNNNSNLNSVIGTHIVNLNNNNKEENHIEEEENKNTSYIEKGTTKFRFKNRENLLDQNAIQINNLPVNIEHINNLQETTEDQNNIIHTNIVQVNDGLLVDLDDDFTNLPLDLF